MTEPAPRAPSPLERLKGFVLSLRTFDRSFWAANISELFERIAFYGMTTFLVLTLVRRLGLSDDTAGAWYGWFGLSVWGLAALSGFLADMLGYRRAMLLAYTLLASGYFVFGFVPGKLPVVMALLLVAFGASLVKPSITGTVQKTCTESQRSLGFSIYYMLVNIGGFLGPNIAGAIREHGGEQGPKWSLAVSSAASVIALAIILLLFREPPAVPGSERKRFGDFMRDFGRVMSNVRFVLMIVLVGMFWCLFWQFYVALPLFAANQLKMNDAELGFVVSLDAGAVVCLQVVVGYLVRNMQPSWAVFLAATIAAGSMAIFGFAIEVPWAVHLGLHPAAPVLILGVLVFAFGEMIYSAHFYRYLGSIAPPDQIGMYMGFAFLPIALGSFAAGQIGGSLYKYCNETLQAPHVVWFLFAAMGVAAAVGMLLLARGGDRRAPAA